MTESQWHERMVRGSLCFGAGRCLAAAVHAAAAQRDPVAPGPVVGRVTIQAKAAAVGVGYTWGDGVLSFAATATRSRCAA